MTQIIITVVVVWRPVIGLLVGYILRKSIGEKTIGNAETTAKNMILDAENRAWRTIKRKSYLKPKEEVQEAREAKSKERFVREGTN